MATCIMKFRKAIIFISVSGNWNFNYISVPVRIEADITAAKELLEMLISALDVFPLTSID